MSEAAEQPNSKADAAAALERQVDEAIAICGGDVRAALRVTLVANSFLEAEVERLANAVSFGFVRGTPARRASEKLDRWREISKTRGFHG